MISLKPINPKQLANKSNYKKKPHREEFGLFKSSLTTFLNSINENESEEHNKTLIRDFLKTSFYRDNEINTKDRADLVIYLGKNDKSKAGVLLEIKSPSNKKDMITKDNINAKSMHEAILYYMRERIEEKNDEVKNIIITNAYEWFIFDAQLFEKYFYKNSILKKEYEIWVQGGKVSAKTEHFYNEIAPRAIEDIEKDFEFVHFDLRDYKKYLNDKHGEQNFTSLFKVFSENNLLKIPFTNDSNSLDKQFYQELLHIIGLEEIKEGSKKLINRKAKERRESGSLIENTISKLKAKDITRYITNLESFGTTEDEQLYNIALELSITWINRILFLKLLEAQLITYHNGNNDYKFLDEKLIKQYDDLHELFHEVLARKINERSKDVTEKFGNIPYLNSSLFEISDLERNSIEISGLKDRFELSVFAHTILKDKGARQTKPLPALQYLLKFLDAYDFSSESSGDVILEEEKRLISASVLGLIFEKINGYKEGSFFTPGFITMYMCRETLRRAVLQKFEEAKGWKCSTIDELRDKIEYQKKEDREEANLLINSIKICDPAAGSGHFLVSALNELITIKSELGILCYRDGTRIKDYKIIIYNDELIVKDVEKEEQFEYRLNEKGNIIEPLQKMQEALFHEKENIIENCLFGVDINPNSVNICRLRLWIELLKNSYYKTTPVPSGHRLLNQEGDMGEVELQTLPNIDINIKQGNSLISRFKLDADLKKALRTIKYTIEDYKSFVQGYRTAKNKDEKRNFAMFIEDIKKNFRHEISSNDPKRKKLSDKAYELHTKYETERLIDVELSEKDKKKLKKDEDKLKTEIEKLRKEIDNEESGEIFRNAFEWRFEFPEVLDDNGNFVGFDVVIGNPPYFSLSKMKGLQEIYQRYFTYGKAADIYCLFYERGWQILKKNGLLTFITSNSWMRTQYGELLRKFFVEKTNPQILINIEDLQIFEEATVETNIMLFAKEQWNENLIATTIDKKMENGIKEYIDENFYILKELQNEGWTIGNIIQSFLKKKIENNSIILKEFNIDINFGVKTGLNEVFIIGEEKKNELIKNDKNNKNIIKPLLRGRDIQKYSALFKKQWVIFARRGIEIDSYPEIKKYLKEYYDDLKPKNNDEEKGRKPGPYKWYEIQDNVAYYKDFEKPKIIWGEISDKPKFSYDEDKYFVEATAFMMYGDNLKYLLAILNSKLAEWYFNQISTTTGMGTNRWKKYKIELLPLKNIKVVEQKPLVEIVEKILAAKKQNPAADTTALEAEIDKLVYGLYGLTEEEIKIVEGQ